MRSTSRPSPTGYGRGARSIAVGLLLLASSATASPLPPNIILILADDAGAETVGAYGGESYRTPQIDRLAREGVRFDHGHAQPLCTPSRVKIMTGKHNFRNYTHFGYLDPNETTFAHVLRDAGYVTAVIGKWQLYSNPVDELRGALPADAGFDQYLLWQRTPEEYGSRYWGPLLNHDGKLRQYPKSVFGPDVLNRQVLATMEAHADEAFFIYYSMVLPHAPWVTTPDMRDDEASDQEKFAAMMAYLDKMVGNVRAKVEQLGLTDRTLVLFIGDNGTDRAIRSRRNGRQVQGAKGETIDAGSHVPFIAWAPGVVRAGTVSESLVDLSDVLPTLAEVAGVDPPGDGDGVSLLPVMRGEGELSRDSLFIHYDPRWFGAVPARYAFDRRWKLYDDGAFFDMQADPREQKPLRSTELTPEAVSARRRLERRLAGVRARSSPIFFLGGLVGLVLLAGWMWRRRRSRTD